MINSTSWARLLIGAVASFLMISSAQARCCCPNPLATVQFGIKHKASEYIHRKIIKVTVTGETGK